MRLIGALLEQVALALVGLHNDRADLVHGDLAGVRHHDLEGSIESLGSAQVDGFLEFGQFGINQRRNARQPPLLVGIVGGQPVQVRERGVARDEGRLIRLEIGIVAGEEVAALPGLGILELGQQAGKLAAHLVGVRHPGVHLDQVGGVTVGNGRNDDQRQCPEAEAGNQPSADRPICEHAHRSSLAPLAGRRVLISSIIEGR
jgi:hypothetical protein